MTVGQLEVTPDTDWIDLRVRLGQSSLDLTFLAHGFGTHSAMMSFCQETKGGRTSITLIPLFEATFVLYTILHRQVIKVLCLLHVLRLLDSGLLFLLAECEIARS